MRDIFLKYMHISAVILLTVSVMSPAAYSAGQSSANYTIESDVISGGGGDSGSANYFISHTTGQSSATGESSSANYSNYAGFWHAATGAPAPDTDGDGVPDNIDNCRLTANSGQQDTDADGYGNMCDADLDNDGFVGPFDFNIFKAAWGSSISSSNWNPDADFDSDSFVGPFDFNVFKVRWGTNAPWE